MTKITATAPTVYQTGSLSMFGFGYQNNPDGSFSFSEEFESWAEAENALVELAERLFNEGKYFDSQEELDEAIQEIKGYGTITLDAVTARIS